MEDHQVDDLKQFIAATVSQAVADLPTRQEVLEIVKTELVEVKSAITDLETKVDTIADALTEDLHDHEQRIIKLEQQAA